jgi:hypothetical protein
MRLTTIAVLSTALLLAGSAGAESDIRATQLLPPPSFSPFFPSTLKGDPSDYTVWGSSGVGLFAEDPRIGGLVAADTVAQPSCNLTRRGILRFDLSQAKRRGTPLVQSATLHLTITQSRRNQDGVTPIGIDGTPPFINPGLGALQLVHIADQPAPTPAAYAAPSIGADPGTVVAATEEPGAQVAISVTAAVRQAIFLGADAVSFRLENERATDGDCLIDGWFVASADPVYPAAARPYITYTYVLR